MGSVVALKPEMSLAQVPELVLKNSTWEVATTAKKKRAELVATLVGGLATLVRDGRSVNAVAQAFCLRAESDRLSDEERYLLAQIGKGMSVPNLKRWLSAWLKQGTPEALLDKRNGRRRLDYGWEHAAVVRYNQPGKPGYSDVTWRLKQEGFEDVTEDRVARYLRKLPATLGKHSPARVGKHLHQLTRQKFQRRTLTEVLVGEIYAGDGHTADCYVAHPNTGKPYRPELTVFIDIKSSYIAGWWLSESESTVSTMFALSHAMRMHNHVPAWVYVDRGPGYRAKLLSDEATGFYGRFDIGLIGALPGNPHGKGWIERFFRTARDKHDKFFGGGQVYCGDDMAPETNRRLSADLAMGRRVLPSLKEYVDSFTAWLEHYHAMPQDKLQGRTPAQVWAELQPVAVEMDMGAIARPREECTVTRQAVRLHNRFYYAEALALFDTQKVQVEYDLHHDTHVWVFDGKGRFIVQAQLANTIGVLPTSRLEEGRDRRAAGQIKRLQRHVDEVTARRNDPIEATAQVAAIEALHSTNKPPVSLPTPPKAEVIDIDLLTWRNDK